MYIDLENLFWGAIGIVGLVALIFLIVVLNKLGKLISNINSILDTNKKNIDKLCSDLPAVSEKAIEISNNAAEITDNLKDVSEVITETTADVIVAKESLSTNIQTIKDILNIILSVFSKK